MPRTFEQITSDALTLPKPEQLQLARILLKENESSEPGAEAAWEDEIQRRIEEIDSGIATGRPFADVLRDIDRKLGR
jgi:hypothetical protein